MSSLIIFKQLLKDDYNKIIKSNFEERKSLLISSSAPLLESIYIKLNELNGENISFDEELLPLIPYFLLYLAYDETTSISLMIFSNIKQFFNELPAVIVEKFDDFVKIADSKADKYNIIKILSELFPIELLISSEIFNKNEAFIKLLTNEITLLTNNLGNLSIENSSNLKKILNLFSSSCIDENSRSVVAKLYINYLIKIMNSNSNAEIKCITSTIIIKIWKIVSTEIITSNSEIFSLKHLSNILVAGLDEKFESALEGLTFLSLNIEIKQALRKNDTFIDTLLSLFDSKDTIYGILVIIDNLSMCNQISKRERESINNLKSSNSLNDINISNNKKISKSRDDNDKEIFEFINKLLKKKIISEKLSHLFMKNPNSKGIFIETLKIIYNFSFFNDTDSGNTKGKEQLVEQGAINILLTYLVNDSNDFKYNSETFITFNDNNGNLVTSNSEIRLIAINALSKLLMRNNPMLIFKKESDVITPIPFLLEEIVQYDIDYNSISEKFTPLSSIESTESIIDPEYVFNCLTALTNLASVQDLQAKDLTVKLAWSSIFNLCFSGNLLIQKASLELMGNLIYSPLCISKFFEWRTETDENYKNFKKMITLTSLDNFESKIAVLNLFASASQYNLISGILTTSTFFKETIIKVLVRNDDSNEISLRCLAIIDCMLQFKQRIPEFVKAKEFLSKFTHNDDPELTEIAKNIMLNI